MELTFSGSEGQFRRDAKGLATAVVGSRDPSAAKTRVSKNSRRLSVGPVVMMAAAAVLVGLTEGRARADAGQVNKLGRSHTYGDFDGDGLVDHVFGYPGAYAKAGSTVVVYGDGEIEEIHRGVPGFLEPHEAGDNFGDSVSSGDIDGDGYDDLVVGVPGDDVTVWGGGIVTLSDAGSIHVIYGGDTGLTGTGDQVLDRVSDGLAASAAAYDRLGEAVAVADFDCDGFADVAVGVPLDDAQSGRSNDGSIHVIYGTASGLTSADDFFHQGTPAVSGAPESNDEFGGSLAVGNFNGDYFGGRACMDLAVGVVGEGSDGGYVVFFYGNFFDDFSFANKTGLSQNVANAEDQLEANDVFGAQMWSNDVDGDPYDDLIVAAPGERCNTIMTAGYHQFHGHPSGIVTNKLLNNSLDRLECVGWDTYEPVNAIEDYGRCMDFGDPGCGQTLTSDLDTSQTTTGTEHIAACEVGIEFALDACEHWISDPVCDVDLCIAAALELSNVATGCLNEGDVLTHGY